MQHAACNIYHVVMKTTLSIFIYYNISFKKSIINFIFHKENLWYNILVVEDKGDRGRWI